MCITMSKNLYNIFASMVQLWHFFFSNKSQKKCVVVHQTHTTMQETHEFNKNTQQLLLEDIATVKLDSQKPIFYISC